MIENVDPEELKSLITALVHQQFFLGDDTIVDRMKHTQQKIIGSGAIIQQFIETVYALFAESDDYSEIIKRINKKFGLAIDENVLKENIVLAQEDGQEGIDLAMFPLADTISAFREEAYERCEQLIYREVKDLFNDKTEFENSLRLMFQKNDENLSLFLNVVVFERMVKVLGLESPELVKTVKLLLQRIRNIFLEAHPPSETVPDSEPASPSGSTKVKVLRDKKRPKLVKKKKVKHQVSGTGNREQGTDQPPPTQ